MRVSQICWKTSCSKFWPTDIHWEQKSHHLVINNFKGKLSAFNCFFFFLICSTWRTKKQLLYNWEFTKTKTVTIALYHNKRLLRADPSCRSVMKEFAHALAVHISSYGCTWEVRRALKKQELLSASSYSHSLFVLSKLPACIHNSIYAR